MDSNALYGVDRHVVCVPCRVSFESPSRLLEHRQRVHLKQTTAEWLRRGCFSYTVPQPARNIRTPQPHSFKVKSFKKPQSCDFCRQTIRDTRSCCKVCNYVCHEGCAPKVVAACEPPVNYETQSHEGYRQPYTTRRSRSPGSRSLERTRVSSRNNDSRFLMDIHYVTERIIVLTFPESGTNAKYRADLKDTARGLRTKHGNKYMVFNLSERRHDLSKINNQTIDFGWPPQLAPPLERLCSICKAIDSWLTSDPQHIAVLHSKGDKGRIGVVLAAYMHYSNICASAEQALDRFAMKRFYDDQLSCSMYPSQKRYVHYFAGLLSGAIRMNNNALFLHHVIIHGIPNFDSKGGCRPFIKIYQGMQPIYSSGVYSVTERARRVIIAVNPSLQLRGDILVKCYHKQQRPAGRSVIFKIQFHTCTLDRENLVFLKDEIDDASTDSRVPDDLRVEFQFSYHPEDFRGNGSVNDAIYQDNTNDPLVKWDSYENFDLVPEDKLDDLEVDFLNLGTTSAVPHTQGPLDGSLYATVNKKKIPTNHQHPQTHHPNNENWSDVDGPHTVSLDSGISSSSGVHGQAGMAPSPPLSSVYGNQITNGMSSGFPSPSTVEVEVHRQTAHPSGKPNYSLKDEHAQLDELLDGMLREIQSIPDTYPTRAVSPSASSPRSYQNTFSNITTLQPNDYGHRSASQNYTPVMGMVSVNGTKQPLNSGIIYTRTGPAWSSDDPECDTPYHTRKNVAPFSYGVHAESPAIQRRRTQSDSETPYTVGLRRPDDGYADGMRGLSLSPEPPRYQGGSASWLQRQQEKLKARKEGRGWEDRVQKEQQLIAELRQAQAKPQHTNGEIFNGDSASSREASPLKINYSTPLHINTYNGHTTPPPPPQGTSSPCYTTGKPPIGRGISAPSSPLIPSRSSSRDVTKNRFQQWQSHNRPLVRQKSDTSHDRERPFVATKKAHEQAREQIASGTSPHQAISSSAVYGNMYPYNQQNSQSPYTIETTTITTTTTKHVGSKPPTSLTDSNDPSGLLAMLEEKQKGSPEPAPSSPGSSKLDELEHSLQALSVSPRSPPQSPQPPAQSTPNKPSLEREGPPSWTPSAVSSGSPPGSPTRLMGDRPPTPAFPVSPRTPYANQDSPVGNSLPPKSPVLSRKDRSPSPATVQTLRQGLANQVTTPVSTSANGQSSPSVYFGQSRRSSMLSLNDTGEVITHHPLFVKDTSKYWYKPNISREDAINMLKDKPPGTFIVRDSNSFPGAFGLALKVATPPPSVQNKTGDISNELVRHFLIEPTSKGVRLKGCPNEPVFVSLSALVYQHSITPLALPCKLLLPESDPAEGENGNEAQTTTDGPNSSSALLEQGAACSLLYLNSVDTELLTGPEAVKRAITETLSAKELPKPTVVHFKVSTQGITLTDNNRKVFFRRHYPLNTISHCGLDPDDRKWTQINEETGLPISTSRCFGFIARKSATKMDNLCHVFAEMEPEQPASAIVNFVTKVLLTGNPTQDKSNII